MTPIVAMLVLLVLVLLFMLWRSRGAAAPVESSTTDARLLRQIPSKLDPRLRYLLRLSPSELHELKRKEDKSYREEVRAIQALRERIAQSSDERLGELIMEISRRTAALPVPLTFGLYFPEDDPDDVARVTPLKVPFVSATISSEASAQDLSELGVHVRNQAGNIFTAYVPLDRLGRLQRSTAINYVELARPWRPQLDVAIPQAQITTLHSAVPPVTGKGVIVGIVDVGRVDFYHPAFRRTDDTLGEGGRGSSRILYLWDQTLAPDVDKGESGPPSHPVLQGFSPLSGIYGTEYSKAAIDLDLANFPPAYGTVRPSPSATDFHGHLVASRAVGNKRPPEYQFTGAAPEADIIYVQTANGDNYVFADSNNILDGFAYIFARASEASKPCVINLSASDGLGPHDGSLFGEQFLDNLLLEPDRAIAVSAGNLNSMRLHMKGTVVQGGTTTIKLICRSTPPGPAIRNETIQIWYDGGDQFSVRLTAPTSGTNDTGELDPGVSTEIVLGNGITKVSVDSSLDDVHNDANLIEIRITDVSPTDPIPAGDWLLFLRGQTVINGAFEGWIDRDNRGGVSWEIFTRDEGTIGSPATARRPISVGVHDGAAMPVPTIGPVSGCGPTRDGRIKPEITAHGADVKGAWPRDMNLANPGSFEFPPPNFPPPPFTTSFAAPIAAGAAALLFECKGKGLTCGDIKQILQDRAGTSAASVPSNSFGFGFLQLADACAAPPPPVDIWIRDAPNDTGSEPYTGSVAWLSPDIEVLDAAGIPTDNPRHDPLNVWTNLVDVTVRNRGTQIALDIEVYLYWADPATNIPFPGEWRTTGFYTGPNFLQPGNTIVVPQLAAGANTTVRFAWTPPAPGANLRGDDHFCLIARLEHQADPSNVNAGGWPVIQGSNNIALRNTHVLAVSDQEITISLFANGTEDVDRLELVTEKLTSEIELVLPTRALPWRELALLERSQKPRPYYGSRAEHDPAEAIRRVLEREEVARILGVTGVEQAHVDRGTTRLLAPRGNAHLVLSEVRLQRSVKMPLRVWARHPELEGESGWVHIGQRSGGKVVGGVSLEIRPQLPEVRKYDVRRRGDSIEVTRRMGQY